MNFPKKIAILLLSLFVSLIVSVIVYFIILLLPVLLFKTSNWTNIDAETMNGYALVGAFIVFAISAHKIYKKLKEEWSNGTQDSIEPESENG